MYTLREANRCILVNDKGYDVAEFYDEKEAKSILWLVNEAISYLNIIKMDEVNKLIGD